MDSLPPLAHPSGLPLPGPDALEHSARVAQHLTQHIQAAPDNAIAFDEWMDLALYAPGLGYYVSGTTKFGGSQPTGDFATAPEMTPLFGYTVARQVEQILQASESTHILEFGAGSGALAEDVLHALQQSGLKPQYSILEVSPDLQARQKERLQRFGDSVRWLHQLPDQFSGCVLANEVLDAMPVKVVRREHDTTLSELYVTNGPNGFAWTTRPAQPDLHDALTEHLPDSPGYQSEINVRAEAWVRQMGSWVKRGGALLIDYGFPRHEYYHPQRSEGTLMCHFRHHAHAEPLILPGLQDITAHVDFTAMADAALDGGLDVLGYTSQARFLLNAGLPDIMMTQEQQPKALSAVQKLLSEAEMGELFKVLAVGKDLDVDYPLLGFATGDRRHRL